MASKFRVDDIAQWRTLCPELHVEGNIERPLFDMGDIEELVKEIRTEGYVNVPNVLPESLFGPLRRGVERLYESGVLLPFSFVYDEFWLAYQGAARFMSAVLGQDYRALPDFWTWRVPAADTGAGWGPHRDRVQPTVDPDNSPHSLTVWLPFSDATPLNGCMYVLPAHLDERFQTRVFDGPGNNHVADPQRIRAVPATAGSFLAWNQALLHWGGRGSRLGAAPRISAAFEFQRGDRQPYNMPLLDPMRMPSFEERLGLIGKQVLQYQHMYPLAPDMERIATDLRDRFLPLVAANAPTTFGLVGGMPGR